jgi:hypothetical protein
MLTSDEIRQVDGAALTKLAHELNLDPRSLDGGRVFFWQQRCWGEAAIDACGMIWRPHERVDQADAALRTLRPRGWSVQTNWYGPLDYGEIRASRYGYEVIRTAYGEEFGSTEALALLRCACLATCARERDAG